MQDLEICEHLVSSQAAVSLRTASRLTGPKWWRNFKGWDASPVSCAFVFQLLTYMWLRRSGEISAAGGWHIAGVRESDGTHNSGAWLRGESCGGKWDMLESIRERKSLAAFWEAELWITKAIKDFSCAHFLPCTEPLLPSCDFQINHSSSQGLAWSWRRGCKYLAGGVKWPGPVHVMKACPNIFLNKNVN